MGIRFRRLFACLRPLWLPLAAVAVSGFLVLVFAWIEFEDRLRADPGGAVANLVASGVILILVGWEKRRRKKE